MEQEREPTDRVPACLSDELVSVSARTAGHLEMLEWSASGRVFRQIVLVKLDAAPRPSPTPLLRLSVNCRYRQ